MTVIQRFEERLTAWSGQLGRDYNPAMNPPMKNRLQAIGEIRSRVSRIQSSGDFSADIELLQSAVGKCQDEFDPMFDTEYGSGRDVHRTIIGLLVASTTEDAFNEQWSRLVP